jgi:8-oxo-dGTP diphosphatase
MNKDRLDEDYPRPIVTVDAVLMTLLNGRLAVALAKRQAAPWKGHLALPGGYLHTETDRSLDDAARRVLAAKTGVQIRYLEQLYTLAGPSRDPRGWSLSVAYCALAQQESIRATLKPEAEMVPIDGLPGLPFDHTRIVGLAVERVRNKASYSSLPAFLLPEAFTLAELQKVYEQVIGARLDRVSFRRRMEDHGFIEPVKGQFRKGAQRPAQLFRQREPVLSSFDRVIGDVRAQH